jgi:cytoskeleton protein RodZ
VVLAVGAYVGWYRLSGEGKLPAETSTQIPTRLAPLAEQAVPPSAPPPATTAAAPTPATVPTGPMQLVTVDPPPVPSVSPSSAAAAPLPPPVSASTDQPRIVLRANADAWVQVRDRSGPVLLNRILHAGDTWDVPAKANLLLTTGNAGGTDLVVDGVSSPSLGGNGAVRRDLPLDPDLIKDGKLSAATTQAGTPRSTTQ